MVSFYSFGLGGLLKKLKEEDLIELSSDRLMKIIFEDGLVCDFLNAPWKEFKELHAIALNEMPAIYLWEQRVLRPTYVKMKN